MRTTTLGTSSLKTSRLAYGCWRIAGTWNAAEVSAVGEETGRRAVIAAYEAGFTLFDHADIYCEGVAERIFGRVLKDVGGMRERILIATKCGIRKPGEPKQDAPYRYDFSAEHILRSCEGSLQRLRIDTIDLYQLHRPDYLMHPEEVAAAFGKLKEAGKVREFGVSNFRPSQLTALQRACPMPLIVNQVEISLAQLGSFDDGTLDQCLAEKITPMAWSPLGGGHLGDCAGRVLPWQRAYQSSRVNGVLDAIAQQRGATRAMVALAWLLRHPAGIIPVIGSTKPENVRMAARADDFELSREEWYQLLAAARSEALP
jgi:predicted oxidoreductase